MARWFWPVADDPFAFLERNRIFEKEQFVPFQLARKADRFDRFQTLVHVMAQLDVKTDFAAKAVDSLSVSRMYFLLSR